MELISSLTDTELAEQITTWSGRIAAGEARLLALIAEFDRREAWGGPGLLSCAHWLVWRTGLSPGAAREKVRVARALTELPRVADALARGRMSFSQARAVTRVAAPDDQVRWVELSRSTTAAQLEKLARGVARVRRTQQDAADPEAARWRLRTTTSYDGDGNLRVVITLPAADGAVVTAALEQLRVELDQRRAALAATAAGSGSHGSASPVRSGPPGAGDPRRASPETPGVSGVATARPVAAPSLRSALAGVSAETPIRATVSEALVEMARRALDQAGPARARRTRARLTAQVDPVSGWARLADGELLPPGSVPAASSLARALRSLPGRERRPRLRPLTPADLARHDQGRTGRLPSLQLRELLGTVDGERCRFPGCTRHRRLHAHHVRFWRDGGRTDLDNLVLLCSRHHTLVHQQGFHLALGTDRALAVATADGVPVLHHPGLPSGDPAELDPGRNVSAETLVPDQVESRMDLGYCVMVLLQQAA